MLLFVGGNQSTQRPTCMRRVSNPHRKVPAKDSISLGYNCWKLFAGSKFKRPFVLLQSNWTWVLVSKQQAVLKAANFLFSCVWLSKLYSRPCTIFHCPPQHTSNLPWPIFEPTLAGSHTFGTWSTWIQFWNGERQNCHSCGFVFCHVKLKQIATSLCNLCRETEYASQYYEIFWRLLCKLFVNSLSAVETQCSQTTAAQLNSLFRFCLKQIKKKSWLRLFFILFYFLLFSTAEHSLS